MLARVLHSAHAGVFGAGLGAAVWQYVAAGGSLPLALQCLRTVDNRAQVWLFVNLAVCYYS